MAGGENEERERRGGEVRAGAPSWCRAERKMGRVLKGPPQFQAQGWAGEGEGGGAGCLHLLCQDFGVQN